MAIKRFKIESCSYDCPAHSQCAYDDEVCNFYNRDIEIPKGKTRPAFCRVKEIIVKEEK